MSFLNQSDDEFDAAYGGLVIATAILERDEDSQWRVVWQNTSAKVIWGEYEIDDDFELKLSLMDAMTRVGPSGFTHQLPHTIETYRFSISPAGNRAFVQFLADGSPKCKTDRRESKSIHHTERRKEDIYRLVVDGARLGVVDWQIERDYVSYSERIFEICNLTSAELGNTPEAFFQRVHSEDLGQLQEAIEIHLENKWPLAVEFRLQTAFGNFVWLNLVGKAVWDEETQKATRFVGILTDISERKSIEEQVTQREALISQVIEHLPIGIYVKDHKGVYRFFNHYAEEILGVSKEQTIGRTDFELFDRKLAKSLAEKDRRVSLADDVILDEKHLQGEKETWLMVGDCPLRVNTGGENTTWLLGFSLDITERKLMEISLEKARKDALVAAQAKSDFLSVMSHEIRTPLNSIIGTSQLLMDTDLSTEQKAHTNMIFHSGEHLLNLINDILDFNKLESGKMTLENRALNLFEQGETCIGISSSNAKLKHLPVRFDYDASLPLFYKGDAARLKQILLNLLSNAIKFTSEGEVRLKILLKESRADDSIIRFEISDSGIGIPADKIDGLFSEFTQVDTSTTRKFGGTGLGLSICKKLVDAMKGEIGIISELGKGSTFWFEIPMGNISEKEANAVLAEDMPELTTQLAILVAEDNVPNQMLIKAILSKLGHQVTIAENGVKAVEAMQSEQVFDLILMDMQMPEMDGLTATKRIREMGGEKAVIPIIALTANALSGDRERVISAGMNDYLTKPIDIKALKRVLRVWGTQMAQAAN